MTAHRTTSVFAGFRFPLEVISLAVRWYLRYGLSYRDVEELLAERGVAVDHVTIYRWVQRFTPEFIEAARPCRHAPGNCWFVVETYLKVAGQWTYLYRAVDQHGQVIEVLLSARRDLAAARRFFARALRAGTVPAEVTTDRAPVYPRVLDKLVPSALHTVEQYANNPDRGRSRAAESPAAADPGDVWSIPTRPYRGPHFAAFPLDIPTQCIKAGCKPGGMVLDPFCGTGTTGIAALALGRHFTGIELNPAFAALAAERLRHAAEPKRDGTEGGTR